MIPSREQMDEFIAKMERQLGIQLQGKTFPFRLWNALSYRLEHEGVGLFLGPNDRTFVVVVYGSASDKNAFKRLYEEYAQIENDRTESIIMLLNDEAGWRKTSEVSMQAPSTSWDYGLFPVEPIAGEAEQYAAGLFTNNPEATVITKWSKLPREAIYEKFFYIDDNYDPQGLSDPDYEHAAHFHLKEEAAELTGVRAIGAVAYRVHILAHLKVDQPVEYISPPDHDYDSCFSPEAMLDLIEKVLGSTLPTEAVGMPPVVTPEGYNLVSEERKPSGNGCDVTRVYEGTTPKWLQDAGYKLDYKLIYFKHYGISCNDPSLDDFINRDFKPCEPNDVKVSFQGTLLLTTMLPDDFKIVYPALQNTNLDNETKKHPTALVFELRPGVGKDVIVITRDEAEQIKLKAFRHTIDTELESTALCAETEGVWVDVSTGDVLVTHGGTIHRFGEWTSQLISFVDEGAEKTVPKLVELRQTLLQSIKWLRSSNLPTDLMALTIDLPIPRAFKNLEKDAGRLGVRAIEKTVEQLPEIPPEKLPTQFEPDQVRESDLQGHTLIPVALREVGAPVHSSTKFKGCVMYYLTLELPTGDRYHVVSLGQPADQVEQEVETLEPVPPELIRPADPESFSNLIRGLITLESTATLAALSEHSLDTVQVTAYDTISPEWKEILERSGGESPTFTVTQDDDKKLSGKFSIEGPTTGKPEASITLPEGYEPPDQQLRRTELSTHLTTYIPVRGPSTLSFKILSSYERDQMARQNPFRKPPETPVITFPLVKSTVNKKTYKLPFDPSPITDDGAIDYSVGVYGPVARATLLVSKFREGWGALWE